MCVEIDMSSETQNTDWLLRQLGGCGMFQAVLTACASLTYVSASFGAIFMTFGSYNPGWRCLDDVNNNSLVSVNFNRNYSTINDNDGGRWARLSGVSQDNKTETSTNGFTQSCLGFAECRRVQFNPESITIATEWGLVCEHAWKLSLIISIQMAGCTLGNIMSGYFGDANGRKWTLYVNVLFHAVVTCLSVASISWEMFATIRFFLGIAQGIIFSASTVYMTEFVSPKWRAIIPSLPMWCAGCIVLSLSAVVLKDWRTIHIVNGVFSILLLLPAYKLPESLRWLLVHKKERESLQAVDQIASMNKANNNLIDLSTNDNLNCLTNQREKRKLNGKNSFSFLSLFRKNFRKNTVILGLVIFTSNIVYYSTSFGITAMPGNIYVNNIVLSVAGLPANIIAWFLPNIFGRKPSGIVVCLLQSLSLSAYIGFDLLSTGTVRQMAMLVFVIIARLCCDISFFLAIICTSELFPTMIRNAAVGFVMFLAGLGTIMSPYMVMRSDISHVAYAVMAVLSIASSVSFLFIPETKGEDLKDYLEPHDNEMKCDSLESNININEGF